MSVEEELWNIFTFYTLHGNALDPSSIQNTQLLKFCRDCKMMDPGMSENPLSAAELTLICRAETVKREESQRSSVEKISFAEFLNCILKVAKLMYPSSQSIDDAFQQLVMDNILPLASRRLPLPIDSILEEAALQEIFAYFQDTIGEVFRFYMSTSVAAQLEKALAKATTTSKTPSYKEISRKPSSSSPRSSPRASPRSKSMRKTGDLFFQEVPENSTIKPKKIPDDIMCNVVEYSDYVRFCHDFGLMSSMGLTSLECGDVFLSTISLRDAGSNQEEGFSVRAVNFEEFWEMIVRSALTAFKNVRFITTTDKLRGMFMYMWRHLQQLVPRVTSGRNDGSDQIAYQASLLRAAVGFGEKFIHQLDEYRDYLTPATSKARGSGMEVLQSLSTASYRPTSPRPGKGGASTSRAADKEGTTATAAQTLRHGLKGMGATAAAVRAGDRFATTEESYLHDVKLFIDDDDDLGDSRLDPRALRRLLEKTPEFSAMLMRCVQEMGLDSTS